jgi:membrane-bound serine protease (ClpP class)
MRGRRFWLLALALLAALPAPAGAASPEVVQANLDGDINSITASYLQGVVAHASADHAAAILIVTNTPGGLSSAMDDITEALLNSPVPVIVYVSPAGARADSAGLFVAQAADLVAMAPGTNIGSAHPVSGSGGDIGGDLGKKVLNDAVARIRNLATLHSRNADWSENAVRNSVNVGAEEAVRLHVADLEAKDVPSLLAAVDGRTLHRPHTSDVTLRLAGAQIVSAPMSPLQFLLHALIDPNVAYLLMLLAIYGLIAEVTTPGAVVPGVVGVISAVLALVALSSLPVTLAGILLLLFAVALFVADIHATTHGVLTIGGVTALVLGSALLFNTGVGGLGLDPWLILGAAVVSLAFFGFILRKAVSARSRAAVTDAEVLVGAVGEAREALDPDGRIFVAGAEHEAVSSSGTIPRGTHVTVVAQKGARLAVAPTPVQEAETDAPATADAATSGKRRRGPRSTGAAGTRRRRDLSQRPG